MSKKDSLKEWKPLMKEFHEELKNYEDVYQHNKYTQQFNSVIKEYAQITIKNLFLLNGGAVIALPAFLNLSQDFSFSGNVKCAAAFFLSGLVFVIISSMLAFFNVGRVCCAERASRDKNYNNLMARTFSNIAPEKAIKELIKKAENDEVSAISYLKQAGKLEIAAIVCVGLSLIFFIAGSWAFLSVF